MRVSLLQRGRRANGCQRVLEQQLEERSPWSLARGPRKALEGKKARGGFGDRHGLNREGPGRLYGETAQMESAGGWDGAALEASALEV